MSPVLMVSVAALYRMAGCSACCKRPQFWKTNNFSCNIVGSSQLTSFFAFFTCVARAMSYSIPSDVLFFFLFVFSEKPFWDENEVCMYVCMYSTSVFSNEYFFVSLCASRYPDNSPSGQFAPDLQTTSSSFFYPVPS